MGFQEKVHGLQKTSARVSDENQISVVVQVKECIGVAKCTQ